jgi:hypothetical protein
LKGLKDAQKFEKEISEIISIVNDVEKSLKDGSNFTKSIMNKMQLNSHKLSSGSSLIIQRR